MNYYLHHIDKFAATIRFLSPEEIGIYVVLKDEYLSSGMRLACDRIANLMPQGCEASLKRVLDRFFVVEDGFYVCEEFEKELSEYQEKASTNAGNAKRGWEKRRTASRSNANKCDSHASGNESQDSACLNSNKELVTNTSTATAVARKRDPLVLIPEEPEESWVDAVEQIRPDIDVRLVWRKMRDYYQGSKKAMKTWRSTYVDWVSREHGRVRQTQQQCNSVMGEMTDEDVPDFDPRTDRSYL